MASWTIVGVGTVAETTGSTLTLTEPAGVANDDLLIAAIASRSTATTAVTNTGWTAVNSQNTNNVLATGSGIGSATMLYQRRSGTPDLTFVVPAGQSVVRGVIVAYRGALVSGTILDVSTAFTAALGTSVSGTGLTTTSGANELIVAMTAGGQEAAWSSFNATTPSGASGATDTTTAPSTTWRERVDSITTTGADTSVGVFDALKVATGATGNLTVTASVSAGHAVVAGAFKVEPAESVTLTNTSLLSTASVNSVSVEAGIMQVGSTLTFPITDIDNAGTVSSAITVPAGTQLVVVGVSGYQGSANGLEAMTFTKGSADTAMVKATPAADASNSFKQAALFYQVSPDIGASKTLKWDWIGAGNSVESLFLFGVTFWKGIDTASPVRDADANQGSSTLPLTTPTLTAQTADLILAFVGMGLVSASSEGSIDSWSNVSTLSQLARNSFTDGVFATGSPSGNTTVSASSATNLDTLGLAAIVLKPTAATAKTVVPDAGSYIVTGSSLLTLNLGRKLIPVAGTYAFTGTAQTMRKGYRGIPDAGTYTFTGSSQSTLIARKLVPVAGTYTFTGTSQTLRFDHKVFPVAGTYTFTGTSQTTLLTHKLIPVAGTYSLTGSTVAAVLDHADLTVTAGTYSFTGSDVTLSKSSGNFYEVDVTAGSYTITGSSLLSLLLDRTTSIAVGTYAFTGSAVTFASGFRLITDSGTYAMSGSSVATRVGHASLVATAGSYTMTGSPVTFDIGTLSVDVDVDGQAVTASAGDVSIIVVPLPIELTGQFATVNLGTATVSSVAHVSINLSGTALMAFAGTARFGGDDSGAGDQARKAGEMFEMARMMGH